MVLGGDFKQMLPVIPHANRATVISKCLNKSHLWSKFKQLKLTINMRLKYTNPEEEQEIREFSDYLLRIGNGEEPTLEDLGDNFIQVPEDICIEDDNLDNLTSFVFDNIETEYKNENYFNNRALLCTTNKTVDALNEQILQKIPETEFTYLSRSSSNIDDSNELYPIEFLNNYESNNLPKHELRLKKYSVIMLMRNINTSEGKLNFSLFPFFRQTISN